jgi:hypothetical protein
MPRMSRTHHSSPLPKEHPLTRRLLVLGLALFAETTPLAAADRLGDRIVEFCKTHLDKQVGNGECAGLATQALAAAGAKRRAKADSPSAGDYVWGTVVYVIESTPKGLRETGNLNDVRPGDIMQYRNVRFGDKGGFAHHTAVVAAVLSEKGSIRVYQQNVGGKRFVTEGQPHVRHLAEGWIRIYRPVPERR